MASKVFKYGIPCLLFLLGGIICSLVIILHLRSLYVAPPVLFSLAYVASIGFIMGFKNIEVKEAGAIFLFFYIGYFVFIAFYAGTKDLIRNPLFADIVYSLVGGGLCQLYVWRHSNVKRKYLIIILNTVIAGGIFRAFWGFNIYEQPHYSLNVIFAFTSWFVIVGSITVWFKSQELQKE